MPERSFEERLNCSTCIICIVYDRLAFEAYQKLLNNRDPLGALHISTNNVSRTVERTAYLGLLRIYTMSNSCIWIIGLSYDAHTREESKTDNTESRVL